MMVSKPRALDSVRDLLARHRDAFASVLPRTMSVDRLLRVAAQSCAVTPKLLECTQVSLLRCVMQCAMLGLEPDGPLGHAHLIPFKRTCTLVIGYRGFIELGWRAEAVMGIDAHPVFEDDSFEFAYGTERFIRHIPSFKEGARDPSRLLAAYCVLDLRGGGTQLYVFDREQAEALKRTIRIGEDSPWIHHEPAMWVKSAIRRDYKLAPLGAAIMTAVRLDEQAEGGVDQTFDVEVVEAVGEDKE